MRFERSFVVDAPPDRVLGILIDVERWPTWNRTTRRVEALDGGQPRVGARYRLEVMGTRTAVWTISRLDDRGFEWKSNVGGVRTVAGHDVAPEGAGTRVQLWLEQTGWPMKVLGFYVRRVANRNLDIEMTSLAREASKAAG